MKNELIKVGVFNSCINSILHTEFEEKEIFRSTGLITHMKKRKHFKCLKYIDDISDIILHPDFVGINPNEKDGESVEFVKRYADNVLVGVKLAENDEYMYISTVHDIQESKIQRRLHSGRIKEFTVDK